MQYFGYLRLNRPEINDGATYPGGRAKERHKADKKHRKEENIFAVLRRTEALHSSGYESAATLYYCRRRETAHLIS